MVNVYLYEFETPSQTYYYTSDEYDVQTAINLYTAIPLSRDEISFDFKKTDLTVTVSANTPPFNSWVSSTPLYSTKVTVKQYPSMNMLMVGDITEYSIVAADGTMQLTIKPSTLSESYYPTRQFSYLCSHNLYDNLCEVNKAANSLTLSAGTYTIDGRTITSDLIPDTPSYLFGEIQTPQGSFLIIEHSSKIIKTLLPITLNPATDDIIIYRGCDKTLSNCGEYNNTSNFGGFPFIPSSNPVTEGF